MCGAIDRGLIVCSVIDTSGGFTRGSVLPWLLYLLINLFIISHGTMAQVKVKVEISIAKFRKG